MLVYYFLRYFLQTDMSTVTVLASDMLLHLTSHNLLLLLHHDLSCEKFQHLPTRETYGAKNTFLES